MTTRAPNGNVRSALADSFVQALAARDFAGLSGCLDEQVRMRALLPPGQFEWQGAATVADQFRSWFGGADELELVDAAVSRVGGRLHLRWRLRLRPSPRGPGWHVVEQHANADATDRIEALDVLCSGFHPDGHA